MVTASKERPAKTKPTTTSGKTKAPIKADFEEGSQKIDPKDVRWTGIKQKILVALYRVNATSSVTGVTQEELVKATKLTLTQVRHQLNHKFHLFTTGVVKMGRIESVGDGRPKNCYYLTKAGVKQASSFKE